MKGSALGLAVVLMVGANGPAEPDPVKPFLEAAIGVTLPGGEAGGGGEPMTPDEAIEGRTSGYTTVEFRVGRVGSLSGIQGEGMPPHLSPIQLVADAPLKGGGEFNVYINGKLLEDLNRLAITPERHLAGAVIRVTGTLRKAEVGTARGKRSDYQMVVLDLEKFRVVTRRGSEGSVGRPRY